MPVRRTGPVRQYHRYEMDGDEILVGFGLPWQDRLRNLPYVARLGARPVHHRTAPAPGTGVATLPVENGPTST